MREALNSSRRPRSDGGWIISYDPDRQSFKAACITIMFAGVWLETAAHLAFVQLRGLAEAKRFDRETYERKLTILGCTDRETIARGKRLRLSRNELVHEKAFLDSGQIRVAHEEADNAHTLIVALSDESGRLALANRLLQPMRGCATSDCSTHSGEPRDG
jgi:hypothetical protein